MTEKEDKLSISEILLRPYVRLARIVGMIFFVSVLFITLTVFGYRGKTHKVAPMPTLIVEHPYGIPILCALLVVSIAGIIFVVRFEDVLDQHIKIEGNVLKFEEDNKMISINLRQAQDVSFTILPFFQILFNNQVHRIGHLKLTSRGKRYSFYFPVRNDWIATELKVIAQK